MVLPITFTLVGYQPTGIKPFDLLLPGIDISNTARQLLSALAIYNIFSFSLNASPLLVEPLGASGYSAVLSVSTSFFVFVLIMETVLSFAMATNKYCPFLLSTISLGWLPVAMLSVSCCAAIS